MGESLGNEEKFVSIKVLKRVFRRFDRKRIEKLIWDLEAFLDVFGNVHLRRDNYIEFCRLYNSAIAILRDLNTVLRYLEEQKIIEGD